jgi:hypothetical protein
MMASKNAEPTAAVVRIDRNSCPWKRVTQARMNPMRRQATSRDRPALTCQRREIATQSAAKTGPNPQRAVGTYSFA